MKLNETNQRLETIQKLSNSDMDGALGLLRELLRHLMEDDSFFVLASPELKEVNERAFLPYIAPVQNIPYLRIFTAREAAEEFCQRAKTSYPIISLNTVSIVKLCKYWMLMGAEGFILNDGQKWTAVSFEQFLRIFFEDVLEQEGTVEADYLLLVKTCIRLDRGEKLFYQKNGMVDRFDGTPLLLDPLPPAKVELVIDGVQTTAGRLLLCWEEITAIRSGKRGFSLTSEDGVYSFMPSESYPFLEIDPLLIIKEKEDVSEQEKKLILPEKIAGIKIPNLKLPKLSKSINFSTKKWIAAAVGMIAVLLLFYMGNGFLSTLYFGNLCSDREYQEAVVYYQGKSNAVFKLSASKKAEKAVDGILDAYMERELDASESTAALSVMASIPNAAERAGEVKTTVDLIEKSRNSYEAGAHTDQVIERLYYWLDVAEVDTANYEAVNKDVQENGNKYESRVLRVVDALIQSGKRGQAKWCLEILQEWFPESGYDDRIAVMAEVDSVPMEITSISDIESPETTLNSIEIYDIDVSSPDSEGYVDLYIRWKNTGTKTIQEIVFYTVPLDNFGGVLSSKKDGNYSLYSARDIGPYKPGKGTPTDSWAWDNVWSNSMISAAEVQQVIIFYTDGTIKSIEDPSRLMS